MTAKPIILWSKVAHNDDGCTVTFKIGDWEHCFKYMLKDEISYHLNRLDMRSAECKFEKERK